MPNKLYTEEDFNNAIAAIKCGLSYRKASLQFGVPKSTLTDRIAGGKNRKQEVIFSPQEEKGFVEYFEKLSKRKEGLTSLEVRNIIKNWLDQENKLISRFKDNLPTSNWVTQFKKRHPELLIKPIKTIRPVKIKIKSVGEWAHTGMPPEGKHGSCIAQNMQVGSKYTSINDRHLSAIEHHGSFSDGDEEIPIVRPVSPPNIKEEIASSSSSNEPSYYACQSSTNYPLKYESSTSEVYQHGKKRLYSGGHIDYHSADSNDDSDTQHRQQQEIHFSSSPSKICRSRSPSPMNCESPPVIVHQSCENSVEESSPVQNLSESHNNHSPLNSYPVSYDQQNSKYPSSSIQPSKDFTALKALEDTLTEGEKDLFYRRSKESSSLELDLLYIAWKVLKRRCISNENATIRSNQSQNNNSNDNTTMMRKKQSIEKVSNVLKNSIETQQCTISEETMADLNEVINRYRYPSAYEYSESYEQIVKNSYDPDRYHSGPSTNDNENHDSSAHHHEHNESSPPVYVSPRRYENKDIQPIKKEF